ncbi:MAG: hypothetical protein WD793_06975 [Steroidobacteraceae bacterium]
MPVAHAVPAFARKYEVPCSACHDVYPKLNPFGRAFRESGFVFPGERVDWQKTIAKVPLSARTEVNVTVSDGRQDQFFLFKPILAGNLGNRVSFWVDRSFAAFRMESRDVGDGDLDDFGTDNAWLRINFSPAFYIKGGKFELDLPYSSRRNHSLFPLEPWVTSQGGNPTVLGLPQEGVEAGGSHAGWHYSLAAVEGVNVANDDFNGDTYVRIARDVGVHRVGGFYYAGRNKISEVGGETTNRFRRYGFDAEARIGRLDLHGVWMRGAGDRPLTGTGQNTFSSGFLQADLRLGEPFNWVTRIGFTDFEGDARGALTHYYVGLQYWAIGQRVRLAVEQGWFEGGQPDTFQFACAVAF